MIKRCYKCKEKKNTRQFYRNKTKRDGFADQCKSCHVAYNREYWLKYMRPPRLFFKYGISLHVYTDIHKQQCGVCSICGEKETVVSSIGKVIALAVDHDHETGKIRGLLCQKCNHGLGLFRDSIDVLASAISYLQQ